MCGVCVGPLSGVGEQGRTAAAGAGGGCVTSQMAPSMKTVFVVSVGVLFVVCFVSSRLTGVSPLRPAPLGVVLALSLRFLEGGGMRERGPSGCWDRLKGNSPELGVG